MNQSVEVGDFSLEDSQTSLESHNSACGNCSFIAPVQWENGSVKQANFVLLNQNIIVGTEKNHLIEMVLLSTDNVFGWIEERIFRVNLLFWSAAELTGL